MRKPNEIGFQFLNYKNFFSGEITSVANADLCSISVEFRSYGLSSNSKMFKNWAFGELLEINKLNMPDPSVESSDAEELSTPFVFVGDEALALSEHMVRQYPNKNLTCLKFIYNYRVSRARRIVECTFGILAGKWRIHPIPVDLKPNYCDSIIKACCLLHNYVRKIGGTSVR